MRSVTKAAWVLGACLLALPGVGRAAPVFGIGSSGTLYSVDVSNGALTVVGNTGLINAAGLAADPTTGTLWTTSTNAAGARQLMSIQLAAPTSPQLVATLSGLAALETPFDLEFLPGGRLFLVGHLEGGASTGGGVGRLLREVDRTTGVASSSFGLGGNGGHGVAAVSATVLLTDNGKVRLDVPSFPPTKSSNPGFTGTFEYGTMLTFDPIANVLYAIDSCNGTCGGALYKIDLATKVGSGIAAFTLGGGQVLLSGLAAVPEPGTASLLAIGCAILARRSRGRATKHDA